MNTFKIVFFLILYCGYGYNYALLWSKQFGVNVLSGEKVNYGYFIAFNLILVIAYLVWNKSSSLVAFFDSNILWVIHGALMFGLPYDEFQLPGVIIMAAGILSLAFRGRSPR